MFWVQKVCILGRKVLPRQEAPDDISKALDDVQPRIILI
jgi:hypothetical protein